MQKRQRQGNIPAASILGFPPFPKPMRKHPPTAQGTLCGKWQWVSGTRQENASPTL
ncbi:hypothetical protein FA13DRAFT_1732379, partial [Coprinellus micaceus]